MSTLARLKTDATYVSLEPAAFSHYQRAETQLVEAANATIHIPMSALVRRTSVADLPSKGSAAAPGAGKAGTLPATRSGTLSSEASVLLGAGRNLSPDRRDARRTSQAALAETRRSYASVVWDKRLTESAPAIPGGLACLASTCQTCDSDLTRPNACMHSQHLGET